MCESDQYESMCRQEFACIRDKLDRLDEAIRGNGKPGIQVRLDRLEVFAAGRSRLLWIIAGSVVTLTLTMIGKIVLGA